MALMGMMEVIGPKKSGLDSNFQRLVGREKCGMLVHGISKY